MPATKKKTKKKPSAPKSAVGKPARSKAAQRVAPSAEIEVPASRKPKGAKSKKLGALDAAAKVLGETGTPMTTREMIEAMASKAYWTSPNGRTPSATLYAAITREIKLKGNDARFAKTERGKFTAKA